MRFKKQKEQEHTRRRPSVRGQTPQAFSYYANRSPTASPMSRKSYREQIVSPKTRREVGRFLLQRFGALSCIVAVALLFVSSVQVAMQPKVQVVNTSDTYMLHPLSTYQTAAETLLKSTWTNSNKITINTVHIAQTLKKDFPELADVSVALPLVGQRPIIYLQLTEPRLVLTTTQGQAYVLDENGRVLSPVSQVANIDRLKLPTVTDESGLTIKVNDVALSSSSVDFITTVLHQLQQRHIAVSNLILAQGSEEFDVHLLGKPYYVKFNLHEDNARQQAGTYLAVQAKLDKDHVTPSEYIDVRLAGRAYYK